MYPLQDHTQCICFNTDSEDKHYYILVGNSMLYLIGEYLCTCALYFYKCTCVGVYICTHVYTFILYVRVYVPSTYVYIMRVVVGTRTTHQNNTLAQTMINFGYVSRSSQLCELFPIKHYYSLARKWMLTIPQFFFGWFSTEWWRILLGYTVKYHHFQILNQKL